jgi:Domain of unknown function (DUF1929)
LEPVSLLASLFDASPAVRGARRKGEGELVRKLMSSRRGGLLLAVAGLAAAGATPLFAASTQASGAALGNTFSQPFQETGLPNGSTPCTAADSTAGRCVPTAVSAAVLANGQILYWNGLEGTERSNLNTVAQFGAVAASDQSRVLDLSTLSWSKPSPVDGGGTNPQPDLFLPGTPVNQGSNDALFCSSLIQLADGRVLATGGTDYYEEPGIPGTNLGVTELQGLRNTRIFDPASNTWSQTGQMQFGRWYPSTVTLADGKVFVASGVTKLIKPVYSNDPLDSGTNVRQTETFDPSTGTWSYNGTAGDHSLPLFPRLHLLPDGKVYYDAAGQTFNPDGQSYDEATWNIAAVYDPASKSWTNLDIPGLGTTYPGFKGSTFSIMLPLTPPYSSASFLGAGGVYGTTPGTYLATNASVITTIDTAGGADKLSTVQTGSLQNPRWYSTGVLLPDGTVMAFSGSRQDGVVAPGMEIPIHQAELFNPATNTWTAMASGHRDRTYHNTAELLPSGAVLVGGHSPIPLGYGPQMTVPGGVTANNEKDPSFEIYYPPYFSLPRPVITGAPATLPYGVPVTVATPDAASITRVVVTRNTSITHLVDGDQRSVVLPIVSRGPQSVTVMMPSSRAVLPAGPYMLFIDKASGSTLIPSTAAQTFVGVNPPGWAVSGVQTASSGPAIGVHTTTASHTSANPSSASVSSAAATGQVAAAVSSARVGMVAATASAAADPDRRAPGALALLAGVAAAVAAGYVTRRRLLATR